MGVKRHAATVETVVVASCNIFHFRFPHTCETQLGKIDMEKIFSFSLVSHKIFFDFVKLADMGKQQSNKGLQFSRRFTSESVNVFDQFEYDYRTSVIRNPSGEVVFEMNNVEVPKQWSQIATDILAQKYFRKAGVPQPDGSTGRETSVKQVAHRLTHCWCVW